MHIGRFWPNELENRAIFDDFALDEFKNRVNFDDFAQMRLKIAPLFIIANKVLQASLNMWREDYVMDFAIFSPEHFKGIQQ